jgi:kinesin family protein 11
LLTQEKAKTARLRTDLIANLSNLIVDFTDTQDASLSAAVAQVQLANDAGLRDMQAFSQSSQDAHAESSRRAEEFGEELEMAKAAGVQQRQSGTTVSVLYFQRKCRLSFEQALGHVNVGLKSRLEEYNKETSAETAERLRRVEGLCDDLAASVGTGE